MPDLSLFHFIRPWALLLIIPAAALYWYYRKHAGRQEGWAALIDQHLLNWLLPKSQDQKGLRHLPMLLMVFWVIACLALAGPTWKKTPQPVFSSKATQVILLDLSLSMDAEDIEPSRLKRAKFKIKDYLKLRHEGLTGLVVYAGDGFILSPLTSDKDTIENLLGALTTKLMPVLGSKPELGFKKAIDLLDSTGLAQGKILWFTDGADQESLEKISKQVEDTPYQVSILAVGTEDGAPIKISEENGFLKDRNGNIVIPQLNYGEMKSFAEEINATLTPVTVDNQDVKLLAQVSLSSLDGGVEKENKFADGWFDLGYWLILLLLPLALLSFKHRALLGCICLFTFGLAISPNLQAAESQQESSKEPQKASSAKAGEASSSSPTPDQTSGPDQSSASIVNTLGNTIENLFLNQNQQAKIQLNNKNYAEAYNTFDDPRWKALSAYRMGSYKATENLLSKFPEQEINADDYYNKANALALDGQYEESIKTYQQALKAQPGHEDAKYNKAIVEQLKKKKDQQQEQQKNDQEGESEEQKQDQKQQSDQGSEQESEQKKQEEQQQEKQSEQQQQQEKLTEEKLKEQFKEEEKDQEMEQWLRRIPDDPGGLLRRKMYQEYQRRGHKQHVEENW